MHILLLSKSADDKVLLKDLFTDLQYYSDMLMNVLNFLTS